MYGEITTSKTKKSIRSVLIHENLYYLLYEIKYQQEEHKKFFGKDYQNNNLVICKQNGEYLNSHTVT